MARTAFRKETKTARKTAPKNKPEIKSTQDSKDSEPLPTPSLAKGARKKSISVKTPKIITPPQIKKKSNKTNVIREIAFFQKNTDMLISKLPFSRYIRDIVRKVTVNSQDFRFERKSILALQEAFEAYVVSLLEDSNLCASHAKRVTLYDKDINLVKKLTKAIYE